MTPGRNAIAAFLATAYGILVNSVDAMYKPIGVTLDWSTVPAVGGTNAIYTITTTGTASAGTYSFTYGGQTATWAYNATIDTAEAAIEALSSVGNGNVRTGGTIAAMTVEFIDALGQQPITAPTLTGTALTGATAAIASTQTGAVSGPLALPGGGSAPVGEKVIQAGTTIYRLGGGKYAPAVAATSLVRGECYITDRHFFQSLHSEQVGEVFDNGTVFESRLRAGGSLPTLAAIKTAFPRLSFHKD